MAKTTNRWMIKAWLSACCFALIVLLCFQLNCFVGKMFIEDENRFTEMMQ